MALHSLPADLPMTSAQLVEELDEMIEAPVVVGPIDENEIQSLVYQAGRRSIVDELVRLLERQKEG